VKKWGELNPIHFDEKELKTDMGQNNTIFVGSSNDMFAIQVNDCWIRDTLNHCSKFNNTYVFQSKNPFNMSRLIDHFPDRSIIGTTIETNRGELLSQISKSPSPQDRIEWLRQIGNEKFITIEPIMDFDVEPFAEMIISVKPSFVNIGADSKKSNLLEPRWVKILNLIDLLKKSNVKIRKKVNLDRIMNQ
jgi:DNA repair photolyase